MLLKFFWREILIMKKIKKILAVLLTAALVFMLPVSAGAAFDPVAAAFMSDGKCTFALTNFGFQETLDVAYQYAAEQACEVTDVAIRILVEGTEGQYVFHVAGYDEMQVGVSRINSNGEYCNWDESDNIPLGAGFLYNDDHSEILALLILFDGSSEYITKIANSDEVGYKTEIALSNGAMVQSEWTIATFENQLGDFRTVDDEAIDGDDTSSDTPAEEIPDEETGDTPVVSDPDDDTIVGGDTDPNVPTEDTTSGDEITGDTSDEQPAPGADEGDDTTSDIPADEVTGNDDTASDNADEEANADDNAGSTDGADDNNKTSADTGAVGVAAAAALAVTAIGAGVLSRRKK